MPDARLEETARVILMLQDQLATLMALLHSLRRQAWQLHDQDYTQYGAGLQQLALECRQLCRHLQRWVCWDSHVITAALYSVAQLCNAACLMYVS